MNTPLRRLATVVLAMFLVLAGSATYIQVFQAPSLNNDAREHVTFHLDPRARFSDKTPILASLTFILLRIAQVERSAEFIA